nr:MAG TPA: hypothetical protein [Herelleviridae sp.]
MLYPPATRAVLTKIKLIMYKNIYTVDSRELNPRLYSST